MITCYMDLDGTLYDLYNIPNWLEILRQERTGAFSIGNPLFTQKFYALIEQLRAQGVVFSVITWLPMNATQEYEKLCTIEKENWCKEKLPFISNFVAQTYGTPKQKGICKNSKLEILIDDNKEICENWITPKRRRAFTPDYSKNYTVENILEEILEMIERET